MNNSASEFLLQFTINARLFADISIQWLHLYRCLHWNIHAICQLVIAKWLSRNIEFYTFLDVTDQVLKKKILQILSVVSDLLQIFMQT